MMDEDSLERIEEKSKRMEYCITSKDILHQETRIFVTKTDAGLQAAEL